MGSIKYFNNLRPQSHSAAETPSLWAKLLINQQCNWRNWDQLGGVGQKMSGVTLELLVVTITALFHGKDVTLHWEDGLVGGAPADQAWQPRFGTQNSCKKLVQRQVPVTPALRRILGLHWSVSLAKMVNFSHRERPCLNKLN